MGCPPCKRATVWRTKPLQESKIVHAAPSVAVLGDMAEIAETVWDGGFTVWDNLVTRWDLLILSGGRAVVHPPIMEAVTHGECD